MAIADTPPQPDARRQQLKDAFIARRGYWTPWLDGTLRFGPDFFEAFLAFTGTPWATGPLPPKVKEFVYIAIDGAITHLYQRGLQMHIDEALRHGASPQEVMEVLQMASLIGLITQTTAAPMLLAALGRSTDEPLDAAQQQRKREFMDALNHWDEGCEAMLRLDAGAFDAYAGYIRTAWQTRALDPVTRELVGIAVHASTTLLHKPGIELHMRRALALGATQAQIMEVLQLTSVLGIHTCSIGVPLLMDALDKHAG
jgi:alkylhydroperoxidase/carboxymuconolactone decarboxylase family protein YurZ